MGPVGWAPQPRLRAVNFRGSSPKDSGPGLPGVCRVALRLCSWCAACLRRKVPRSLPWSIRAWLGCPAVQRSGEARLPGYAITGQLSTDVIRCRRVCAAAPRLFAVTSCDSVCQSSVSRGQPCAGLQSAAAPCPCCSRQRRWAFSRALRGLPKHALSCSRCDPSLCVAGCKFSGERGAARGSLTAHTVYPSTIVHGVSCRYINLMKDAHDYLYNGKQDMVTRKLFTARKAGLTVVRHHPSGLACLASSCRPPQMAHARVSGCGYRRRPGFGQRRMRSRSLWCPWHAPQCASPPNACPCAGAHLGRRRWQPAAADDGAFELRRDRVSLAGLCRQARPRLQHPGERMARQLSDASALLATMAQGACIVLAEGRYAAAPSVTSLLESCIAALQSTNLVSPNCEHS